MQIVSYFRQGYGVASLATVTVFLTTLFLGSWSDRAALALYVCAVGVSAYVGGLRAGLFSVALAALGLVAQYFLLPATSPLRQADLVSSFILFGTVGVLASYLSSTCAEAVAAALRPRPLIQQTPASAAPPSLEQLKAFAASAPAGMVLLDPSGQCVYSNPACRTVVGFAASEALDDGWTRFIHPEDHEFAAEWRSAARRQEAYATEVRFQNSDGRIRWAQLRAAPLRTADGQYLGHLGILEDLAAYKETEDELGRQEKLVQELRRRHEQQIAEIESRLTNIQQAQGLVQGQLSEKQQTEEELRQRLTREQADWKRTEERLREEWKHTEERLRQEWKRGEERLREENTELCLANTVLEQQLAEARAGADQRGDLERLQEEWKRTEDKLRREIADQRRAKQTAEDTLAELRQAKQAAEDALAELRETHQNGRSDLERRQAEWKRAEDKLRRQVGDLTDTTKLLEDELAEWQRKEQQLRATHEQLGATHAQLQRDLEKVRAQHHDDHRRFEEERARWQREQTEREEKWRRGSNWLDRIAERLQPMAQEVEDAAGDRTALKLAIRQLGLFANGLWAASRLARRDLPLRAERLELGVLVQRVVDTAAPLLQSRGQHLTVKLPLGPEWLQADPVRCEQALLTLLDNAARHTASDRRIELAAEREQEQIVFRIQDDGPGLTPTDLAKLRTLDARERRFGDGLGLGLALARGLIEEQAGQLEIDSQGVGHGTEFRVSFRAARAEEVMEEKKRAA